MKASELKRSSEQAEQEVLFEWLGIMSKSFPELKTAVCYSADKAIKIVTDYLSTYKRKDNHYDNTRSNKQN